MSPISKNFFMICFALMTAFSFAARAETAPRDLFHHANDPIGGNPLGKVTIVEFFDYQCSHCIDMAPVMQTIIKANPDVRVVYKEFPIRGPASEFAARAALAANKQGKYAVFSHNLLTTNLALSESSIFDLAKASGLDIEKLKRDMNSNAIRKQLNDNLALAQEKQITGTPVFFIGKTNARQSNEINYVLGEMSQSELQSAIDKARN